MDKSTRFLIAELAVVIALIVLLAVLHHPLLFPYAWHKLLHVLGSILFVGNIIVTGVWMFMAERTGNAQVMAFGVKAVNWADVFFTVPGIFLIIANGDILAEQWGGVFHEDWVAASLVLFALSGVIWTAFLLACQNKLISLSQRAGTANLPPRFTIILHRWYFWGAVATILPLISLILMFLKPALR